MNKSELIEKIASEADLSKAEAERALNATTDTIQKALKKGGYRAADRLRLVQRGEAERPSGT